MTINGCGFAASQTLAAWQGNWLFIPFIFNSATKITAQVPVGSCSITKDNIRIASNYWSLTKPDYATKDNSSPIDTSLSSVAPTNPGSINSSCMTSSSFDACVFYKNPVAQQNKIFTPQLSSTLDLSSIQTYGVKIDALGLTLDSDNISVCGDRDGKYSRFVKNQSWKISYVNSRTNFELEQIMAYYWLNQQINTMKRWTGDFYAANRRIQVFAYHPTESDGTILDNAYWESTYNRIVMGRSENMPAVTYGLAAEVYAHEMGHANMYYASPQAGVGADYCADKNGCIGAIHEGQADYHAALMFGPGPIGESIINDLGGLSSSTCSIGRTISQNSGLTADSVFKLPSVCKYSDGTSPTPGEIHDVGALYASIWWEVRQNAAKAGKSMREVDQLFMEHLAVMQSADTFVTSLCKIKDIDVSLFGSRFSQLFSDEYKRRGLPGLESCP